MTAIESREELEARLQRFRILHNEAQSLLKTAKVDLEHQLRVLAAASDSERGGLAILGEIDWYGLTATWDGLGFYWRNYQAAISASEAQRERIDAIVTQLADFEAWKRATEGVDAIKGEQR